MPLGYPITIAVMGCRVNGPGETDSADLGLWCGPSCVNLKRGGTPLGAFSYEEILPRLKEEGTRRPDRRARWVGLVASSSALSFDLGAGSSVLSGLAAPPFFVPAAGSSLSAGSAASPFLEATPGLATAFSALATLLRAVFSPAGVRLLESDLDELSPDELRTARHALASHVNLVAAGGDAAVGQRDLDLGIGGQFGLDLRLVGHHAQAAVVKRLYLPSHVEDAGRLKLAAGALSGQVALVVLLAVRLASAFASGGAAEHPGIGAKVRRPAARLPLPPGIAGGWGKASDSGNNPFSRPGPGVKIASRLILSLAV